MFLSRAQAFRSLRAAVACLVCVAAASAYAQVNSRVVRAFKADPTKGRVTETFSKRSTAFAAFRIDVKSGRIDIRRIRFVFWNGQRQVVARRFVLRSGEQTPWLARFAGGRRLRSVTIDFSRGRGQGVVLVLRGENRRSGTPQRVARKANDKTTKGSPPANAKRAPIIKSGRVQTQPRQRVSRRVVRQDVARSRPPKQIARARETPPSSPAKRRARTAPRRLTVPEKN